MLLWAWCKCSISYLSRQVKKIKKNKHEAYSLVLWRDTPVTFASWPLTCVTQCPLRDVEIRVLNKPKKIMKSLHRFHDNVRYNSTSKSHNQTMRLWWILFFWQTCVNTCYRTRFEYVMNVYGPVPRIDFHIKTVVSSHSRDGDNMSMCYLR